MDIEGHELTKPARAVARLPTNQLPVMTVSLRRQDDNDDVFFLPRIYIQLGSEETNPWVYGKTAHCSVLAEKKEKEKRPVYLDALTPRSLLCWLVGFLRQLGK